MALEDFTVDKNSVLQNTMFTVTLRMRNISNFGRFPGGQWGTALVDNNGNIAAVTGTINFGAVGPQGLTGSFGINSFVPETIEPGLYRLMSVIRPTGGEWDIIKRAAVGDGVPNSIDFEVR